jgi:hypothetical protein
MAPLQVKGLEEEAERAAEAEQATLAAMRRDAEDTQVRPCLTGAIDIQKLGQIIPCVAARASPCGCNEQPLRLHLQACPPPILYLTLCVYSVAH